MKKLVLGLSFCVFFYSCGEVADGNGTGSDGVGSLEHRIFASSSTHNGNLGGASGADTICQNLATAAGLSRSYEALVSTDSEDADDKLRFSGAIYIVDTSDEKTLVAGSGSELWGTDSANLTARINVDEDGNTITTTNNTWTGTNSDGGNQVGRNCSNWSSSSVSIDGFYGNTDSFSATWVENNFEDCANTNRIYCVSQ